MAVTTWEFQHASIGSPNHWATFQCFNFLIRLASKGPQNRSTASVSTNHPPFIPITALTRVFPSNWETI
jgi:hypothetical protein